MLIMSKFKHVLLAIAIAIVFVFFIGFGISSFYKTPKYEDFCGEREKFIDVITRPVCDEIGGKWNPRDFPRTQENFDNNQLLCTKVSEKDDVVNLNCHSQEQLENQGFCERDYQCRKDYDDSREKYNRNVFIFATGIGIIILILGFALNMASVSSGLMGGGILTIIYGTIRYWSDLPDFGRFVILGITLTILIWLGYKKISKSKF